MVTTGSLLWPSISQGGKLPVSNPSFWIIPVSHPGVTVGVGVGVGVDVAVGVGVGVGVGLAVAVAVGVGLAVGVGVGVPPPVGTWIATVMGEPVLKKPTVALALCGG